jgi:subtilisin family serine protease/cytochrome oxidase Cu insertion factor (SCO1/SenC/PrrC family)
VRALVVAVLLAGVARAGERIPIIVTLADHADLASVQGDKATRRARVVAALQARVTPPAIDALLRDDGVADARRLWLINGVAASVTADAARRLAAMPGVARVMLDATVQVAPPLPAAAATPDWNLAAIHAPDVWALGSDGTGVVVANMDTGVDLAHVDLGARWRGGPESWFDPYTSTTTPYDAVGHGTGTMGILAGGNALGVAPGAHWIAAKIFDDKGNTTLSVIHEGFQWLLAPGGGEPPDVVNASWGLSWVNLCDDTFQTDLAALRTAGIFVVFSAGNSGPEALTSISPANNQGAFSAGAIDATAAIASFSSRGAGACTNQTFPDLVAPGVNVRTAAISLAGVPQYQFVSGTSFAAPHIAGAAALLRGAFPDATVDELEAALRTTAHDLGTAGPDEDYGYGLVDVAAAYAALAASHPLRVVTARLGDATRDRPYAQALAADGGVPPYQWSLDGGSLPAGLSLDAASGEISGNAHGASSRFTVVLTDGAGTRAHRTLAVDVYSIPWNLRNEALTPPRGGLTMNSTAFIHRLIRAVVLPATTLAALAGPVRAEPHKQRPWARTTASYRVPDVALVRADGAHVTLRRELDDGKPVILNFIFTSCAAICPVMTQTFADVQRRLGDERVHLVSLSIDPEADTPARLGEYAKKFAAGAQWSFYTGSLEASIAAQKAFDVYRGDKMNHAPVTFLRVAPGQPWVRLEGFAAAEDVVAEYRRLRGPR